VYHKLDNIATNETNSAK